LPAKQRERRGGTRRSALGSERKVHANPSRGRASGASPSGSQQCGVPSIGAWWVISRLHNWDDVRLDQPPYGRRGGGIDLGNVRSTPGVATMHRALNRRVVGRGIYSRRRDTWAMYGSTSSAEHVRRGRMDGDRNSALFGKRWSNGRDCLGARFGTIRRIGGKYHCTSLVTAAERIVGGGGWGRGGGGRLVLLQNQRLF